MWRPDLHPLPCPQSIGQKTGVDGRRSFAVLKAVPSGTVLDISLCVEVSVTVVDQFPVLWDFVIMDATTQTVCQREDAEKSVGKQYTHTNKYLCLCQIPQACIPLSYAAQIPTTRYPDLANVRVSLSTLDQEVRKCIARVFVSAYLCVCVCVCVRVCVWETMCMCVS